jgi:hypothetical protein
MRILAGAHTAKQATSAKCFSIWQDELDSGSEVLPGDLREAISDFLTWNVKNLIGELLPILNQHV